MERYCIGLDIGSTTAKAVVTDLTGNTVFTRYERHHAGIRNVVERFFAEMADRLGECEVSVTVTGSVGMGLAEGFGFSFIQEVIAATEYVKARHSGISTIIDIGGEDAKVVFLEPDGTADLRMNGNCAGGTGAFIDQMAVLLGVDVNEMDILASGARHVHPIASRCGVFSKTDVQNLMAKNVSREDIAASVFRAVAVQTVVTLSHGCRMQPKILLCGGPLTFIPSLRRAFMDYMELPESDFVVPADANLIPAWGAAISGSGKPAVKFQEVLARLRAAPEATGVHAPNRLGPIFASEQEYTQWKKSKEGNIIETAPLEGHTGEAYLGIDSGSTTTKIVVADDRGRILFSHYAPNGGNSIGAVRGGLELLQRRCQAAGIALNIRNSCSTGYGEELTRAAFGLRTGVIETIAHYVAARSIDPSVSFILDIGGQDMKAIFIDNGVLNRMEINEACSSGCGSFLETFAHSLGLPLEEFSRQACLAAAPCDLGTRCTVFMNSKVKQVMREGATLGDIAAGLSYSVVKNCLYKVLKLKKTDDLGGNIVVQGGTMRNDSVVGALERLTGAQVSRSNMPELMGAYGCALYARTMDPGEAAMPLGELLRTADYTSRQISCGGCENNCFVQKYTFGSGNTYFSGNKCEKVFSNRGADHEKGRNMSAEKNYLIFGPASQEPGKAEPGAPLSAGSLQYAGRDPKPVLGIPRCLGLYENYPFWQALFGACGIPTVLSAPSTFTAYEAGAHSVMSDNICFPAKLAHSHIYDLMARGVDRIFFPYVHFEKKEGADSRNSYNCPIVAGYSEVIRSAINPEVPVDAPVVTFRDEKLLEKGCIRYLATLGIGRTEARRAFEAARAAQDKYENDIRAANRTAYEESRAAGKLTILLAGRPYHTDPLVQHKISDMISDMGVTVITEDIVRDDESITMGRAHVVTQWSYINRIIKAAQWVAQQGEDIHFAQLTSFGCGPDAFLLDEVRDILGRHGKSLTLLKVDDVNNIGSLRLRVRSLVESLRFGTAERHEPQKFVTTREFTSQERHRTLIAPFFTDYISPLIPAAFRVAGYNLVQLGESDMDSAEYGLKYANNEVCYPATLVIGDLLKALDSGKYDPAETAVIITQTGGQCRASNYVAVLKRAMVEAGYQQVPVLSLAFGSGLTNQQSGFRVNWAKLMPIALAAILFGDTLSKFYHASAVRETKPGDAKRLREEYLGRAQEIVSRNKPSELLDLISTAACDFNAIITPDDTLPKVGIVGEIYLKFNSFAHKRIVDWLIGQKIEVIPPALVDFFMESFVNRRTKHETGVQRSGLPLWLSEIGYSIIWKQIEKVNRLGSGFRYFTPFHNIFEHAANGREIITLSAQYGEGWLLPAEVVTFAKSGVNNVISLQPFGCIANHIISKGMEKKIKACYPKMNLLSLDFDSGVSDVNVTNRLMLLTNNLR